MNIDPLTLYLIGIIVILSTIGIIGYLDGRTGAKKPTTRSKR